MILIRQPYDGLDDAVSIETAYTSDMPTRTKQEFKEEADVNNIVNRFLKTGELPDPRDGAKYGDFMDAPWDYHEAMNFVLDAQNAFMELPAEVRKRFDNDAGALMDFLADPKNRDEAESLGLVEKAVQAVSEPLKAIDEIVKSNESEA